MQKISFIGLSLALAASTQLIDFDDKRFARLYKREYNVLEVLECPNLHP